MHCINVTVTVKESGIVENIVVIVGFGQSWQ